MATIRFKIECAIGNVTLGAFINSLRYWQSILADVDTAVSGIANGSIDWVVTDLGTGSLCATMEARNKLEGRDYAPEVAHLSVSGIGLIEREGTIPPFMSEKCLGEVKKLLKTIGSNGVAGFQIAYQSEKEDITARASANIDLLLPPRYTTIGSIVGRIETISIHNTAKFVVYHDYTNKAVTCSFPEDWMDRVKDALGKRVDVAGKVHWNAKDEPVRVEGEDLRILKLKTELPSILTLAGSEPEITGEFTTEEYIRRMRANA